MCGSQLQPLTWAFGSCNRFAATTSTQSHVALRDSAGIPLLACELAFRGGDGIRTHGLYIANVQVTAF
jgi:hypothetical protein